MNQLLVGVLIAVAGLSGVEIALRRRGGRRWPDRRRWAAGGAVATLLTVLVLAPRLGLRYGESLVPRLVAGALFLLLLVYLAQLLPRLRPLLGRSLPRNPSAIFFWLPLIVYLALTPWASNERPPDGDEPYYLLVAHSLAYDFDAELTNNYAARHSLAFMPRALKAQPHDPRGPSGEMYSRHNVLLPALLAPAYRLGGKYGALALMCCFAAALAWTTLRLARHFFADQPGPALLAYFILAFTSPLLLYSHQVWVEIPAALLVAIALDAVWAMEVERARSLRAWMPILVSVLFLPLLKIRFLVIVATILVLLAWRLGGRSRRLVGLALLGIGVLAGAILSFNYLRYDNILKYHDISKLGFYWNDLSRYPKGLAGLLFDVSFGLFASAPIWALLLAPGPGKRKPLLQLAWVMLPYTLLLVPRSEWYGAWSPPFRYGCVALALLALLLIPPLARRRGAGARLALGALFATSVAFTTLWVARPGWTYNIAHGRSHLVDFLTVAQGHDVARFLPSAVRPNLALWIWPPIVALVLAVLWRWPRRRSTAAGWLGAALPLAGLVALTLAAHRLPTRVAEVEDPYILRDGGAIWPEDWVVGRTRFHGGWRLRRKDTITIPVVPGGDYCSIELEYKRFGKARPYVQLRPGLGPPVIVRLPQNKKWATVRVESVPWTPGPDTLEISLRMPPGVDPQAAILLDRVHLSWSDAPLPEARD